MALSSWPIEMCCAPSITTWRVDNRHRGIVLAGIGQGGLYAQRLLADRFQTEPLKGRLAAAYILDDRPAC